MKISNSKICLFSVEMLYVVELENLEHLGPDTQLYDFSHQCSEKAEFRISKWIVMNAIVKCL